MSKYLSLIFLLIFTTQVSAEQQAAVQNYADRKDVRNFIKILVKNYKFDGAELLALFRNVKKQQAVLDAIAKPAETTLTWDAYRAIFINNKRIVDGVKFWNEHEEVLRQAQEKYGVPPEIIVAIIGVETSYGEIELVHPVLDSLVTLGFDGKSRRSFFRQQLAAYLVLTRKEQLDPTAIKGSYAGAMGIPQFIPTSYQQYAVDFDGDGKRDILNNVNDAVGSVAHYFKRYGWKPNQKLAVQVSLRDDSARQLAVGKGRAGLKLEKTVKSFAEAGVRVSDQLPEDVKAMLIELELDDGNFEYWLCFKNFYVITRYNISSMYAMAVKQLSNDIKRKRRQMLTASINRSLSD